MFLSVTVLYRVSHKKWCVSLLLQQANAPFFLGHPVSATYQCSPSKPNQITGQINLDLTVKSVLLTGYLIWFAGSALMSCRYETVTEKNVNKPSSEESLLHRIWHIWQA